MFCCFFFVKYWWLPAFLVFDSFWDSVILCKLMCRNICASPFLRQWVLLPFGSIFALIYRSFLLINKLKNRVFRWTSEAILVTKKWSKFSIRGFLDFRKQQKSYDNEMFIKGKSNVRKNAKLRVKVLVICSILFQKVQRRKKWQKSSVRKWY